MCGARRGRRPERGDVGAGPTDREEGDPGDDHHGGSNGEHPLGADEPAVPATAAQDLVDVDGQGRPTVEPEQELVHVGVERVVEQREPRVVGHEVTSSVWVRWALARSFATARCVTLFTVPRGMPSCAAVSTSDRSAR